MSDRSGLSSQPSDPGTIPSEFDTATGFFGRLFDTSFATFVTPTLIKVLYILLIVISAVFALIYFVAGISQGGFLAFLTLIVVPLFFLISIIVSRVYMEVLIVLFRVAESTQEIARNTRNRSL